ncbi:MAG: PrsW family glutamic-type intramembrane protease [Xanthomonadales bacterium]|nr:PrsW family glutamic-type intramembrane protease [Xanthomonadales bacterium]
MPEILPELLQRGLIGLVPVVFFLIVLVLFDSYKLVSLRLVVTAILLGGLMALPSYVLHTLILRTTDISFEQLTRYGAPVVEELLKGAVIIYFIARNRIGFLVDASIFGFAVGAGFALIENLYYLGALPDAGIGVWIVRGFGTAVMHGGATAIFAVASQAFAEQREHPRVLDFLPGLVVAALIHSLYNHFFLSPVLSTVIVMAVMPVTAIVVVELSERTVERWLDVGFDSDAQLLALIRSGQLTDSPVGRYLQSLREHFQPEVLVDLICYLRLRVELALRAKGLLMMQENGFKVEIPQEVQASLVELRHLEKSIGPTGLLALKPFLQVSRKDLWQLSLLAK